MQAGHRIYSPTGFATLKKGIIYNFVRNDAGSDGLGARVFLVQLSVSTRGAPRSDLLILDRDTFERGMISGAIVAAHAQFSLPPWLASLRGIDLGAVGPSKKRVKDNATRVDARLKHISIAVSDLFFEAPDPYAFMNKCARECTPAQNETRFRRDCLTYLACGRNRWALSPRWYGRTGTWDRQVADKLHTKMGRTRDGYPATPDMRMRIKQSFLKRAAKGMTFVKVYRRAIYKDFGCTVTRLSDGTYRYLHPKGSPFPSVHQFRYHVILEIGLVAVQMTLYGETRYRNRIRADMGKTSETRANAMEGIESDGHQLSERPRGLLLDVPLSPLVEVRGYCVTTGIVAGVGYSLGAETAHAYRLMLFCMAVDKVWFCRTFFGMTITREEWPHKGLPSGHAFDRGPGAAETFVAEYADEIPVRTGQPSYEARSKATAESGHPRDRRLDGEPSHIHSTLNVIELVRKAIGQVLADNAASDAGDRMDDEMKAHDVLATPNGLYTHLDERGRNNSLPMERDDAIRLFLTKRTVEVRHDGVWLGSRRYDHDPLAGVATLRNRNKGFSITLDAYIYDLSIRTIFVEVGGKLFDLQMKQPLAVAPEKEFLSLEEADLIDKKAASKQRSLTEHRHAAYTKDMIDFEADTGKDWDSGRRRRGRPKRTAEAAFEEGLIKTPGSPQQRRKRAA